MSAYATTKAQTDVGSAWRRHRTAQLRQRHQQLGLHFHLDVDALLDRGALSIGMQAGTGSAFSAAHLRRATVDAIDYCALLATRPIGAF